jgi:putative SOS response-associated peptidase YedK
MPVILPTAAESIWLDPTISKEHALSLLDPYPAELMVALAAPRSMNGRRAA